MSEDTMTPNEAAPSRPVLVLVDSDDDARARFQAALIRRFGADYQVLAADLGVPGIGGVEFLERAHALHPRASRALLLDMEPRRTRIPSSF